MMVNDIWLGRLLVTCLFLVLQTNALPPFISPESMFKRTIDKNVLPAAYAPSPAKCPRAISIRVADKIAPVEKQWLAKRQKQTIASLKDLFSRMNIKGFNANQYIDSLAWSSNIPRIGIAMSGGGYRAMLTGAGVLAAFDDRTPGSKDKGNLGGLLQSASYVSGISGGAWLVGSLYANNFSSSHVMMKQGWKLDRSLVEGPVPENPLSGSSKFWNDAKASVDAKREAEFDVTVSDYWGRSLSYLIIDEKNGAPGMTWSSIAEEQAFTQGKIPMPIIIASSRDPHELVVSPNATNYEFTPFEMGSWDNTVLGMAPTKYIGSFFSNGQVDGNACFTGADNTGFIVGTSSSTFNAIAAMLVEKGTLSLTSLVLAPLKMILQSIAMPMAYMDGDIACWPNMFYGWRPATNKAARKSSLSLVDGGLDGQNIPIYPFLQPSRTVDVVFAIDSSADMPSSWPNGTALITTYRRFKNGALMPGAAFPSIPDENTFINFGFNKRPTFFGCGAKNISGPAPLIVYVPNAPYTMMSNLGTITARVTTKERDGLIRNGYNVATMGGTDPEWPECVGCAILSRSFERSKAKVPQQCQQCFKKYCWDGKLNSKKASYNPSLTTPKGEFGAGLGIPDKEKSFGDIFKTKDRQRI